MAVLVLVLVAGCGVRPEPVAVGSDWGSLPTTTDPRPIVLFGDPVLWVSGFATDSAKLSAGARDFVLDAPLPETPDDTTITPREAFDALMRGRTPMAGSETLRITGVELGEEQYLTTDRGAMTLPVWRFHVEGGVGVLAWPADDPGRFWRLGAVQQSEMTARSDGPRLLVQVYSPPRSCPGHEPVRQELVVVEAEDTVTISTRIAAGSPTSAGNCVQRAILESEIHEVVLRVPLGDRLLLDDQGRPAMVEPA